MSSISPLKVPVILIAGLDPETMAIATMALGWDLPNAVAVRHDLDPSRDTLIRTISDATGLIEREEVELDHACASCALREDVIPTLERLAASGRWDAIVSQLPPTASPAQVCRVTSWDPARAPHVRISAVVAALNDATLDGDLLGDELLCEVDLPVREDDRRGLAETACALVEYADVVFTPQEIEPDERDLISALMRPGALFLESVSKLDGGELATGLHHCETSDDWVEAVRRDPIPSPEGAAWALDVHSDRPFHPGRLQEFVAVLGGGPRRSRGCFWLPTRPHQLCIWNGAGGQLSIGTEDTWGPESPLTRIVIIGLDGGHEALAAAFRACLLTDKELDESGPYWEAFEDGFEPWLGPIRRAA